MKKNIKLFYLTIITIIVLFSNSKAELNNKIIISVGNEMITDYDVKNEIKYLSAITAGQFKKLSSKESREIAIDSLIKDKIKTNVLSNHSYINVTGDLIENQILQTMVNIGFNKTDDFKDYLKYEEYEFNEFKKKIILELKWNQLVYQFYKNQIVIDKEKIDKKLEKIIDEQEEKVEYLIYEIFIEDSMIKRPNDEKEVEKEEAVIEEEENKAEIKKNGIIIVSENVSYDNEKKIRKKEPTKKEETTEESENKISLEELTTSINEIGFENTARQFSSSPTSENGGSLGWLKENEISNDLLKSIKNIEIGKITKPISVTGGLLILKIHDKKVEKEKIDLKQKMNELIDIEKNKQLTQFSSNYFNQAKNNIKVKYFDD